MRVKVHLGGCIMRDMVYNRDVGRTRRKELQMFYIIEKYRYTENGWELRCYGVEDENGRTVAECRTEAQAARWIAWKKNGA